MHTLWQDLRFGMRSLVKSPGFAAVAILTLALGIGANTAIFSVVNGVLLNTLPYPEPDQLVTLHESKPNFATGSISFPNFRDWRDENQSFSSVAVYRTNGFNLTGVGDPERVSALFISSEFFPVQGIEPVIGRSFRRGEDEIGAAPVAVICGGLWERKFGKNPDVLGKSVTLDGKDYVIVGVVPESFSLFFKQANHREIFVPIGQWTNNALTIRGAGLGIHGIARLKPGVSVAQAQADMNHVTANLAVAYPDADKGIGAAIIPFKQSVVGGIRPYLLALLAAVGFVLLIACVNVGNLLLTRAASRSREFAIRAAMGAGQGRIIRQLITEGSLLSIAGGGLGLLLAWAGTRFTLNRLPFSLPRAADVGIDSRVLIFTAAVSILAGILFGLAPALKTGRPDLNETLKESGRGGSGARHKVHGVFVVVEMAMALVLLVGAGLMIRTLSALWTENPGFDPSNVMTFGLSMPSLMASPGATRAIFRDIDRKIASTPGAAAASISWGAVPMAGDDETLFWHEGQPRPSNQNAMNWTLSYVVDPGYLNVMRIRLLRGRFFSKEDDERAPAVVVVDDAFARQYFGNEDPVGKRISMGDYAQPLEIVGVVNHVNQWGLASDSKQELHAQMYRPFMQLQDGPMSQAPSGVTIMVRNAGMTPDLFERIRSALGETTGQPMIFGNQSMQQIIASSIATQQFSMILLGIFAAAALILASMGIYGVVSHLVSQRTHEIGVRVALGAQRIDILRLVLIRGIYMALAGAALGILGALALTRFLATQSLLFSVSATDPLAFGAAAALLIAVALMACFIPARRATRVDPIIVLRCE